MFAYYCDKLECCLQAKLYDERSCVNLNNPNKDEKDPLIKEIANNNLSLSQAWIKIAQENYDFDDNFMAIADYIKENEI